MKLTPILLLATACVEPVHVSHCHAHAPQHPEMEEWCNEHTTPEVRARQICEADANAGTR